MNKIIDYKDLKGDYILVDVRSPGEFADHNIPGAVSVPLFDDEQRSIIGTVYKQESIEKAKKIGVEYAGQNLPEIYEKIIELKNKYKMIVIYCARGGMRSGSLCGLLGALGLNVWQLRGGYKGYRATVNEELPQMSQEANYIVLHGLTGVGKTEILKKLPEKGLDVLDLEYAANHRGSLLGSVGIGACNSQKQFEGLVYESLKNRKTNNIFVEAESKRIGSIIMGDYIKDRMSEGRHILVNASIEKRAKLIIEEYTKNENCKQEIIESLNKIRKYMGNEEIDRLIELTNEGKYYEVTVELMEKYYDPMYQHTQAMYEYDLTVNSDNLDGAVDKISKWAKENGIC